MKPSSFDYVCADSIAQALTALQAPDSRVLAGGQTLGPMLNLRLAAPAVLVDIGRIPALRQISRREGVLEIGAGATHASLEDRRESGPLDRLLAYIASTIAFRAIRNRGTIGGSLSHADPAADWVSAMTVLDARLVIASLEGSREHPMREFFKASFSTLLKPGQVLTGIRIPELSPMARWGYCKICRKVGEYPEAIGAVVLDEARSVSRIVAGALDDPPAALDDFAVQVASEGLAATDARSIGQAIATSAPGLDAVALQLHTVAVRRALLQALGE